MFNNEEVIFKTGNGINYIQFKKLLRYGIKHCYTLKSEGVDFSRGSKTEIESYKRIANELNIDYLNFVKPVQTHTDIVKCIDKVLEENELENVDGIITDKKNIVLTTKNADCILMLFYDPIRNVIANVHSGWKGTFKKISEKTVQKMITLYKCNPKDIICCMCPSIRKCHFEVDEDVKDLCVEIFNFTNRIDDIIEIGTQKDGKQKYMIDTILINKILLEDIGLKPKNIIDSVICSVCNNEKIHSARSEGKNFQRATAIILL